MLRITMHGGDRVCMSLPGRVFLSRIGDWLRALPTSCNRLRRSGPDELSSRSILGLSLVLTLELVAFAAVRLPVIARLENFLFFDWGANLTVQDLLDRGRQPIFDFFYPYGLLPPTMARVWYTVVARTPWGYLSAVGICHILLGWGLARCLVYTGARKLGVVLVVVAIPFALPPTYPNLAHGLEIVLLVHAVAELARNAPSRALALATTAVFCKPSMAYVLGAVIIGLSVSDLLHPRTESRRSWPGPFALSTLVGAFLSAALAAIHGGRTLLRSLLPLSTAEHYKLAHYGFFHGTGRRFWFPPDARLAHYLATPRAFWLAASIVLVAAGASVLFRNPARPLLAPERGRRHAILACAVMHLAFVTSFFGNEGSWVYYSALLLVGVSALAGGARLERGAVLILAVLAIGADRALPRELASAWRGVELRSDAHGLWCEPQAAAAWEETLKHLDGGEAVVLCSSGCAPLLVPGLAPSSGIFLLPGMESTDDFRREAARIRAAGIVIVPTASTQGTNYDFLMHHPWIHAAMTDFQLSWSCNRYEIYRRRETVRP